MMNLIDWWNWKWYRMGKESDWILNENVENLKVRRRIERFWKGYFFDIKSQFFVRNGMRLIGCGTIESNLEKKLVVVYQLISFNILSIQFSEITITNKLFYEKNWKWMGQSKSKG